MINSPRTALSNAVLISCARLAASHFSSSSRRSSSRASSAPTAPWRALRCATREPAREPAIIAISSVVFPTLGRLMSMLLSAFSRTPCQSHVSSGAVISCSGVSISTAPASNALAS